MVKRSLFSITIFYVDCVCMKKHTTLQSWCRLNSFTSAKKSARILAKTDSESKPHPASQGHTFITRISFSLSLSICVLIENWKLALGICPNPSQTPIQTQTQTTHTCRLVNHTHTQTYTQTYKHKQKNIYCCVE